MIHLAKMTSAGVCAPRCGESQDSILSVDFNEVTCFRCLEEHEYFFAELHEGESVSIVQLNDVLPLVRSMFQKNEIRCER
jgi:hypothetical protein